MGTRILKIDREKAEKIEVEDRNPNSFFRCCKKHVFKIKSALTCLRNTSIIKVGVFLKIILKFANKYRADQKRGIEKKMGITSFKFIRKGNVGGVLENSGYLLPDGH